MAEIKIEKFLYYRSHKSDKIWGIVSSQGKNVFKFWCRRPKEVNSSHAISINKETGRGGFDNVLSKNLKTADKKVKSGYLVLDASQVETYVPGFTEELASRLVLAQLADSFNNSR